MASTPTKKPSLGRIPKDAPKETTKFLQRVKEILEVGEGQRGDSLDKYLTFRNLVDAGLVERLSNGTVVASPSIPTFSDITQFPGYTTQIPETPVNVTVTGGFSYVFVSWDIPVDPDSIISHAEIWRSETDALGTAVLSGTSPSSFYVDELGTGSTTYYYWVRFVSKWSTADVPIQGPYNAVAGTSGATVLDPAYVLETLEGQITSSQLNTSLNTLIDKIEPNELAIKEETRVRSEQTGELYGSWTMKIAYDNGETPYVAGMGLAVDVINGTAESNMIIASDTFAIRKPGSNDFFLTAGTVNGVNTVGIGSAHIHDLAVTNAAIQNMAADKLFAETGTIANAIIGTGNITNAMIGNVIQSNNYQSGVSGWIFNKDGTFEADGGNIRNILTANSIEVIDTLMLKKQAVTFPVQGYISTEFIDDFSATTNWVDVITLVIPNIQGAPQFLSFSGRFKLSSTYQNLSDDGWDPINNSVSSTNYDLEYQVLKNGSVIRSPTRIKSIAIQALRSKSTRYQVFFKDGRGFVTVSFNLYENNPAGTNNTYKVQYRMSTSPPPTFAIRAHRRECGLMSLETKDSRP